VREPYLLQQLSSDQKNRIADLILHLERAYDSYDGKGITPEFVKELDLAEMRFDECKVFIPNGYLLGSISGATLALTALATLHLVEAGKLPKTDLLVFIKTFHLSRVPAPLLADRFHDIADSQLGWARGYAYRNGIEVKGDKLDTDLQRIREKLNTPSQQPNEVKKPIP
jgi:hypothetical protein